MPKEPTWREQLPDMLDEEREKITDQMVLEMGPSPGAEDIPHGRELELFWHTTMPPEQQAALWQDPNMTPETFSRAVYPTRWKMLAEDGRVTEEAQAKWAAKMAAQPRPAPRVPGFASLGAEAKAPADSPPLEDEFDGTY